MPVWLFFPLAFLVCLAGLGVVLNLHPVRSAMCLVVTLFLLAVFFIFLDASFVAALQVIVYAGAIMVVFLFVIMLLNLGQGETVTDARGLGWKLTAGAVSVVMLAQIFALTRARTPINLTLPQGFAARQVEQTGAIAPVAGPLFNEYLLAFEVTSVLLLAAVVGAVILGKQRGDEHAR